MLLFREHAQSYAAAGLYVFPCDTNKHPLIEKGCRAASVDQRQIDAWSRRFPDSTLAIATGQSGLVVVDIDVKAGKKGAETWSALVAEHGYSPTFATITDSGGWHLYYRDPVGTKNTQSKLGPDVDTRGDGGYVMAYPPSEESMRLRLGYAPAPEWLLTAIGKRETRAVTAPTDEIAAHVVPAAAQRAPTIADFGAVLARWEEGGEDDVSRDLRRVLAGQAWGRRGGREIALSQLCLRLMRDMPWASAEGLAQHFVGSCAAVETEDGAYTGVEWVAEKFESKRLDIAARAAETARETATHADDLEGFAIGKGPERGAAPSEPPSMALSAGSQEKKKASKKPIVAALTDLPVIARHASASVKAAVESFLAGARDESIVCEVAAAVARACVSRGQELDPAASALALACDPALFAQETESVRSRAERARASREWIVGTPQGYFLRAPDGYQGPFPPDLVPARARDVLRDSGLVLERFSKGEWGPKGAPVLLHEYGTVPRAAEFTLYGETALEHDMFVCRLLGDGVGPAAYDAQIAEWLKMLAGPQEPAFLDWLATFRRFDRPTCAVMLKAFPGVGKGLLADGLGTLWGRKPVPFLEAISPFNGALISSPFVVADEALSAPVGMNPVDEFKKLVGDSSFRVADKNIRATTLRGCVRVLLNSNHNGGFRFNRELTEADVAALDQRVLLLAPAPETSAFLASLGGRNFTESWVQGGAFAAHVRWLEQTRQVSPGSRFLVEGRGGMAQLLSADSKGTSPLLKAVVKALRYRNSCVRVLEDGDVVVHRTELIEQWATLSPDLPLPLDLQAAWGLVCIPGTSRSVRLGEKVARVVSLRKQLVLAIALSQGYDLSDLGLAG